MLTRILHRIVSNPRVYDWVQWVIGLNQTQHHLSAQIARLSGVSVLDVGGGTGIFRNLWPAACHYLCLDIDMDKLQGFRQKNLDGIAVLADSSYLPLRNHSVDVILCCAVSHHLSDALLEETIRESKRVLKPTGKFIFQDAIWKPSRPLGRLLWKYDRGSYPRSVEYLRNLISAYYASIQDERYSAIFHEYFLCVAMNSSGDRFE